LKFGEIPQPEAAPAEEHGSVVNNSSSSLKNTKISSPCTT